MPHQGTLVATWILMCLVLALIWIATILAIRVLIGGRAAGRATPTPTQGTAEWRETEAELGHLDNTFTSTERDSYHRRR